MISKLLVYFGGENIKKYIEKLLDDDEQPKEKKLRSVVIQNDSWSWELLPDN